MFSRRKFLKNLGQGAALSTLTMAGLPVQAAQRMEEKNSSDLPIDLINDF